MAQYGVAAVDRGGQPGRRSSPTGSSRRWRRRSTSSATSARRHSLPWLLPLLYVLLALTLVAWAGLPALQPQPSRPRAVRVHGRHRADRAGAARSSCCAPSGQTEPVGVGTAATLLGCAMLIVAAGSLLPSVEDWFGARRELRTIQPILDELGRRHPDVGIGVRPRGPLVFRVAERMSLISDALFLEATAADSARRPCRRRPGRDCAAADDVSDDDDGLSELAPQVSPREQADAIAHWIHDGSRRCDPPRPAQFPGLAWLRQPADLLGPGMDPRDRPGSTAARRRTPPAPMTAQMTPLVRRLPYPAPATG